MIDTKRVVGRRTVHYRDLADLVSDAENLAAGKVATLGNWTFGQILQHLTDGMNGAFTGFGFQAPWFVRTFVAPFVKNQLLTKGMSPGIQLPKRAESLLPADVPADVALQNLRSAVARMQSEVPTSRHPFFGRLAAQEWRSLSLRHAELHMSFVVPKES